jgi:membrane-bound lytic murein transglycosylase B
MARHARPMRLAVIVTMSLAVLIPFTARSETAPAHAASAIDPWSSFIAEAAQRFAIPAAWIRAVMRVESNGNVKAVSPKGAVGLMQIMPDTYAELQERYDLGADPADPHDNILAGAAYLREMHDRFGASGFLAAYNVGPSRYQEHLATGRPLPEETRNYVASLAPLLSSTLSADTGISTGEPRNWQKASLFVPRSTRQSDDARLPFTPQLSHIRPDRGTVDLSALTPLPGGLFIKQTASQSKP